MKKLLLPLLLLPLSAFAQDTLFVKGGTKFPVTIQKVDDGKVYYTANGGAGSMPIANLERYYWSEAGSIPQRKDNVVYIETEDSPEEAFVKMGKILAEENFTIITANKEIGIINTASKPLTGVVGAALNANVRTKQGKTIIAMTGIYDGTDVTLYGVTSKQESEIWYATSNMNTMSRAWDEMERIAKAYSGGKITYGKR
ncbi:hypothetical protein [Rufibacter soli]